MGGITRLLLLLWAGVTLSTAVDLHKRIIGGAPCKALERHYHVKIVDKDGALVCGGSLISNQLILTAAHCKTSSMTAVLGPIKYPITAQPVILVDGRMTHDIMLLNLPEPTKIRPVDPPTCNDHPVDKGAMVQIAGHGSRTNPNNPPDTVLLQCANVKAVKCPWDGNPSLNKKEAHQHMFCSQDKKVNVCNGDSGGGAIYNGMIYGVIVSSGTNPCSAPPGFMDICKYKPFFDKHVPGFLK